MFDVKLKVFDFVKSCSRVDFVMYIISLVIDNIEKMLQVGEKRAL